MPVPQERVMQNAAMAVVVVPLMVSGAVAVEMLTAAAAVAATEVAAAQQVAVAKLGVLLFHWGGAGGEMHCDSYGLP